MFYIHKLAKYLIDILKSALRAQRGLVLKGFLAIA